MEIAVYSQPHESAQKWKQRGCTVAFKAERRIQGTPPAPTVPIPTWDSGMIAAGLKLIREPRDNPHDDQGNTSLLAWLYPQDEPDNKVVEVQDSHGDVEAVYKASEDWCAYMRTVDPTRELVVNLGLEQYRWNKVDYKRLVKPYTKVSLDYYPIHRGLSVQFAIDLIRDFQTNVAGPKLAYWFTSCSFQNLNKTAYPNQRSPTPNESQAEWDGAKSLGLSPGLFPQQLAGYGLPFSYDAMTTEMVAAFSTWVATAGGAGGGGTPPPSTAKPVSVTLTGTKVIVNFSDGSQYPL